jgi:uncharacterized protein (DUF849 family)
VKTGKETFDEMNRERAADLIRRARSNYVMNRKTGEIQEMVVPGPSYTARDASDLRAYSGRGWFRMKPSFSMA